MPLLSLLKINVMLSHNFIKINYHKGSINMPKKAAYSQFTIVFGLSVLSDCVYCLLKCLDQCFVNVRVRELVSS